MSRKKNKQPPAVYAGLENLQAAPIAARLLYEAGPGAGAVVVTPTAGAAQSFAKQLAFFLSLREKDQTQGDGSFVLQTQGTSHIVRKKDKTQGTSPFCLTGHKERPLFVWSLPEEDPPFLRIETRSRENETARILAMTALVTSISGQEGGASGQGGGFVVVCPVSAAIRDVCGPETFASSLTKVAPGEGWPRDELIRRLAETGYRRTPYTESPGEFSARGDIVDVFPLNHEEPYRLSYFDTEIESIRPFDPETQKSVGQVIRSVQSKGNVPNVWKGTRHKVRPHFVLIAPAEEPTPEGFSLVDWIGEEGLFICLDPERIGKALKLRETEAIHDFDGLVEEGEADGQDWDTYRGEEYWGALLNNNNVVFFTPETPEDGSSIRGTDLLIGLSIKRSVPLIEEPSPCVGSFEARYPAALYGQLDLLSAELKSYVRRGFDAMIVCATGERLEKLREFLEQEGLEGKVELKEGELAAGIELTSEKAVWLSDGDIFKSGKKGRRQKLKGHEKISAFTDIEKGDYVVHEKYGIGAYRGIKTIETYGSKGDYLAIAYSGKDVLYLPAWQLDRIQKYIGGGERKPRLSKLGSDDWTRTKARVRAEIEDYAAELIKLAAERKLAPGYAFSPDTVWQKDFDDRFPFEPTQDQYRCFDAVRGDMENPWPMDRLICGDVGYGKTEVALRAVFKCVQDGKQAIVLVPTTILAAQHFRTFQERFSDFPVRVEMLSRFVTGAQAVKVAEGIKTGEVDIVIGTHALLSKKLLFKNPGLLVIDEEQRFGVRHKERIRGLKAGVDVLTLSATPIPRTLNMSLLGIKDMELIEDPPEDRYPVRTYVSEERPDVIAEALRRELDRGGQAYVVFNRIEGLDRTHERLRELAPMARIGVCHAKMNERVIEDIMQDFYENEFDVLLSTTIIESGLDIPNVNTIVILDADRLGLTQLYQLRGRVGRTNRIAFAYLMYRPDKILTEAAEKRLRIVREFTEFGSGFKIAMKDLEMRGAGNLLGTSQHGHMASVGYEMYCKLLGDAVRRIESGGGIEPADQENDCRVEMPGAAVIPAGYIEDEVVKLQAYKRISFVRDEESMEGVLAELRDRFGAVPGSVMALARVAWLRNLGEAAGLSEIKAEGQRAYFVYREAPADLAERVFKASERAHRLGAVFEADMTTAARLKLALPQGTAPEEVFEAAVAVLKALGKHPHGHCGKINPND